MFKRLNIICTIILMFSLNASYAQISIEMEDTRTGSTIGSGDIEITPQDMKNMMSDPTFQQQIQNMQQQIPMIRQQMKASGMSDAEIEENLKHLQPEAMKSKMNSAITGIDIHQCIENQLSAKQMENMLNRSVDFNNKVKSFCMQGKTAQAHTAYSQNQSKLYTAQERSVIIGCIKKYQHKYDAKTYNGVIESYALTPVRPEKNVCGSVYEGL